MLLKGILMVENEEEINVGRIILARIPLWKVTHLYRPPNKGAHNLANCTKFNTLVGNIPHHLIPTSTSCNREVTISLPLDVLVN